MNLHFRLPRHRTVAALLCCACLTPGFASAFSYAEGVDGDLSDDPATPTALAADVGANTLTASSGGGDFDYLTVTIGAGQSLASIFVTAYSGGFQSFTGVQFGAAWTEGSGSAINAANLLGWSHFGVFDIGTDILDDLGSAPLSTGFTPPLGPGDYTFLLQDTAGAVDYTLTFNVVPEPGTALLVAGGLVALGIGARRR